MKQHIIQSLEELQRAQKRAEATGEEYCVGCYRGMGFSSSLRVDHPLRHDDGAVYVEGSGQWCACCHSETIK
jgi:hypothetical protein